MRRVETNNYNQLAFKEGGGCQALFGLPFLAAGIGVIFAALMGTMKTKGGAPVTGAAAIAPALFGLVFACVGAVFVFGRSGFIFDRGAKTVTRWYGLLFPMWTKVYEWRQFTEVTITRETRRSKNSTYTVYPVRLTGTGDKLDISEPRDEGEARKLAEEIAKFMDLGVTDSSGGTTVRREAGTLDEPLRDRLRRTGQDVDISAPPAGMRATFSAHGNAVSFSIPLAPFSPALLVPVGCAVIFGVFVGLVFFWPMVSQPGMPGEMKWLFGGFFGLFFILMPLASSLGMVLAKLKRRSEIEADGRGLRVTTHGVVSSKTVEIPGEELEELRVEQAGSEHRLAAVSDKQTARFGEGLPPDELEWIRGVILKAIAS
ncbi:MAG: hypothetical protein NTW87_32540 [Planctomycetota bacterium]|nr:hypothetical protein [Planctomycetota bacterium]